MSRVSRERREERRVTRTACNCCSLLRLSSLVAAAEQERDGWDAHAVQATKASEGERQRVDEGSEKSWMRERATRGSDDEERSRRRSFLTHNTRPTCVARLSDDDCGDSRCHLDSLPSPAPFGASLSFSLPVSQGGRTTREGRRREWKVEAGERATGLPLQRSQRGRKGQE